VDLGEEVLVFDSFLSIAAAKDLKTAVIQMTGKPTRWVVNSHSHNDHIRGNQVFVPGANIISSQSIRDYLSEYGKEEADQEQSYAPERLASFQALLKEANTDEERKYASMWLGYFEAILESYPDLEITLPDVVFSDSITIYGSKRIATLIEFQRGHTDADIVLYLPNERILFTGDLVFTGMHPFLADGDPTGLRRTLAELLELPLDAVVPGHGETGKKEDIKTMIDYIDAASMMAMELKSQGKTPVDTGLEDIPDPYRDWQFSNFFQTNLEFLYEHLSEEK
jgi:glyoxylase-like metal-dependent hydrolase (beta-lactamase superfamily II)